MALSFHTLDFPQVTCDPHSLVRLNELGMPPMSWGGGLALIVCGHRDSFPNRPFLSSRQTLHNCQKRRVVPRSAFTPLGGWLPFFCMEVPTTLSSSPACTLGPPGGGTRFLGLTIGSNPLLQLPALEVLFLLGKGGEGGHRGRAWRDQSLCTCSLFHHPCDYPLPIPAPCL